MNKELKNQMIIFRQKFEDLKHGDSITCKEWDEMQHFIPTGYGYSITKRTIPQSTLIFERYLPSPNCKNNLDVVSVLVLNSKETMEKHIASGDDGKRGEVGLNKYIVT